MRSIRGGPVQPIVVLATAPRLAEVVVVAGMCNHQVINVNLHALQGASIFCPADVSEVSRSGRNLPHEVL